MSDRVCYRYKTRAIFGPWRRQAETACDDAVKAGQMEPGDAHEWLVTGEIEASHCDKGGAGGGKYPSS